MSVTVGKTALIDLIAPKTNMTKADVDRVISAFVDVVMDVVADGDSVSLKGFGTFEPRKKGEKTISNSITGNPVVIPAHTAPAFKPGVTFKARVKGA